MSFRCSSFLLTVFVSIWYVESLRQNDNEISVTFCVTDSSGIGWVFLETLRSLIRKLNSGENPPKSEQVYLWSRQKAIKSKMATGCYFSRSSTTIEPLHGFHYVPKKFTKIWWNSKMVVVFFGHRKQSITALRSSCRLYLSNKNKMHENRMKFTRDIDQKLHLQCTA